MSHILSWELLAMWSNSMKHNTESWFDDESLTSFACMIVYLFHDIN